MKKSGCLSAVLLMMLVSFGQTRGTATLYGFKQPVTPGTIPGKVIDEQGKEVAQEQKQRFNYLIYMSSAATIYPSEIWINGTPYAAGFTTVKTTPVKLEPPSMDTSTVLVPKTGNKVIQLNLSPVVESKLTAKGRAQATKNELVVVYKSGGRFYYEALSKFTMLNAVEMQ